MIKKINKINSIIILFILILNLLFPIISIASDEIISITFQDENLYNAIVERLEGKIESKEDSSLTINMTQTNLESVTMLVLGTKEIEKIDGLEKFTNLAILDLTINNISDIRILSNLTNLSFLNLSSNNISDISELSGLTNLNVLGLAINNINDIKALSGLTNLSNLELSHNNISDISALSGLTNLEDLDLGYNNNISDINFLSGLIKLDSLKLSSNNISDIRILSNLTNLSVLNLSSNNISDISPLATLTNLNVLHLSRNNISNINSISGLTNLESLRLDFNNITDISPLSTLTKLTYLDVDYNNVSDISALSSLTNPNISVKNQSLSTTSLEEELELPPIFLQVQDENSKIYTEEEFSLVNCTLNENKDRVTITDASIPATVTINGGNADGTILEINSTDTVTPLVLEVSYSTTRLTNGNIEATITANKEIQEVEGWTLSEDRTTLTKTYEENAEEIVTVYDLEGNSAEANIGISNIDKIAPEVEVSYSTTAVTNENVEVTIIANERIQEVEGWTLSEDGTALTKIYAENGEETVEIYDIAGNKVNAEVSVQNIEEPEIKLALEVSYSTTRLTNGNVEVTITANKEIQEVEGWILSEDRIILTKTYEENAEETVTVYDLEENSSEANIDISNIDKIAPEVEVSYSTTELTNGDVEVTIKANEIIQEIEGWTISEDGTALTKTYKKNAEETVTVNDLAGNSTVETIEVNNIVDENNTANNNDNTVASSTLPYAGQSKLMIGIIAIVAIVVIILKRKLNKYKGIE